MQADPAGIALVHNSYRYANNQPLGNVDPLGLQPFSPVLTVRVKFRILSGATDRVAAYLKSADEIWSQCCIKFKEIETKRIPKAPSVEILGPDLFYNRWYDKEVLDKLHKTDQAKGFVYAYLIKYIALASLKPPVKTQMPWAGLNLPEFSNYLHISTEQAAELDINGAVVQKTSNSPQQFAHEMGHVLGLSHRPKTDVDFLMHDKYGNESNPAHVKLSIGECMGARMTAILKGLVVT
jgi:hypothetical protein